MTQEETVNALDEQIAKAEATLREVIWTAEGLRATLVELKVLKSTMKLMATLRRPQEAVTT